LLGCNGEVISILGLDGLPLGKREEIGADASNVPFILALGF
jgi:hypothetical protein